MSQHPTEDSQNFSFNNANKEADIKLVLENLELPELKEVEEFITYTESTLKKLHAENDLS